MRAPVLPTLFGRDIASVHCLGVGGMGVAPLAIYLARMGWTVSGEDDGLTPEVSALLADAGVRVGALPATLRPCRPLLGDTRFPPRLREGRCPGRPGGAPG